MSEEEKQKSSKEDDQITGNAKDIVRNQNIDVIDETSDYYSNDAIYSINDYLQDSEKDLGNLIAVEASDVLMIQPVSGEQSHEQSSNEKLEATIFFQNPSNSEDLTAQSYFDNGQNLHFQENVKGFKTKDIHSVSKISESEKPNGMQDEKAETISRAKDVMNTSADNPKSFQGFLKLPSVLDLTTMRVKTSRNVVAVPGTSKFVDHSSDEFADTEDNSTDSYDSCSDSGEYFGNIKPHSGSAKSKLSESQFDSKPVQEGKVGEINNGKALKEISNKFSSSSCESFEETVPKNIFSNIFEPTCSYSPQRLTIPAVITTKEGNIAKKNLSTVIEIPELEENNQNLIGSPPLGGKNPLKMKTKVGIIRKDKCNVCNVRLGLCAIKCRCGGYYCAKHRYDKEHNCTFDYKSMGADEIRKNNPRVIAEKVRKL